MLTAESFLKDITSISDRSVDCDSMADIVQNSVIEGVEACQSRRDFSIFWVDEENDCNLVVSRGVNHFFLGVENGNVREYISCSRKPRDLSYTVETVDSSIKPMRYCYRNSPKNVIANSMRILSVFERFFYPESI